jgi:hypothetical protein
MRITRSALIAALLLVPAVASAQHKATAVGQGARAVVNVRAGLMMPEVFRVVESSAAQATWQGDRFTEYLIKFTVAANTQWSFAADALPHGVTLLARGGEWRGAQDSDLVVQRGAVTNGTEVLVRVRVADGASIHWREELKFSASASMQMAPRFVAED